MVYFIQCNDDNKYIKIGWTAGKLSSRFKAMQTGCPYPLKILGILDCRSGIEHALHHLFREHKVFREWYVPADKILKFIEESTINYDEYKLHNATMAVSNAATKNRKIRIR